MRSVKIKAATDAGEIAMRKHMEEVLKMGRARKMMLRQLGIKQSVTCSDPYEICVQFGKLGGLVRPVDIMREIRNALEANGAKEDHDYITEVQE